MSYTINSIFLFNNLLYFLNISTKYLPKKPLPPVIKMLLPSSDFAILFVFKKIVWISSSNKLKDFISNNVQENRYQKHKKDGISIYQKFVQENEQLASWTSLFQAKKQDDLADAFLQGIWYIKHKNIISYAENLNINCVTLS